MSKTLVTFLLDRSGSMELARDDTIGAFNAYLDTLKQGDGIEFTFVQFDSMSLDKVCVRLPIKDVKPLTYATYVPRATTPLIDAAYKTIKAVEASLNGDAETKVVICIQTDGEENCSREYTWEELNTLIKEKSELGWQFNFMGVGIDAYNQGAKMGIQRGSTVSYAINDSAANLAAFSATASNTMAFATGQARNTMYSGDQKQGAGDVFDTPGTGATPPKKPRVKPIVDDLKL